MCDNCHVKGAYGYLLSFYQDAVNQIGSTESVLHSLYKKVGRKDHVTKEILEKQLNKQLKQSVFSHVFLKPDRMLEQRLKHKKIVAELKKSIQEAPEKHHFIKNGEVCNQTVNCTSKEVKIISTR